MNIYRQLIEEDSKIYELLERIYHDYKNYLSYDDSYDLYHAAETLRKRVGIIKP